MLSPQVMEGVSLLEQVCPWEWAHTGANLSFCLLPEDQDVKLSATAPASCLSASRHDDNGLIL